MLKATIIAVFARRAISLTRCALVLAAGILLCSCSSVRYYAQAVHGQGALLVERRPLDEVISDPSTDATLAARLREAQQARRFASHSLGLPDNRSYTTYVALHRPHVVWNVFAAPRFSVRAVPQCFPIAGCVAYRGWFSEAAAEADAARLRARGDDVWVGGVAAYSTLGWFADPILSSMLRWDDDELAGTIFHELAHQLAYVKGDTTFNESFATFVQEEGLREWRKSRGLPPTDPRSRRMDDQFVQRVLDLRTRLEAIYTRGGGETVMAAGKRREIARFRVDYAQWRERHWPNDHRHDAWVAAPINNARLLPFGLYRQWLPAFATLFELSAHDWRTFYDRVRKLAHQPQPLLDQTLRRLCGEAAPAAQ